MPDREDVQLALSFKLVLIVVLVVTLVALAVDLLLTYIPAKGNDPKGLADTCSTVFKLGTGALFGLTGGKATR